MLIKLNLKRIATVIITAAMLFISFPAASVYAEAAEAVFEFEAEDGVISGDNVTVFEDSDASGGKALKGNTTETEPDSLGYVPIKFSFEVENEDTFTFWYRGKTSGTSGDTLWLSIDGNTYTNRVMATADVYKWFSFTTEVLTAGTHCLNISFREPEFYLDKVLITSDNGYLPDGNPYSTPEFTPSGRPRVMINSDGLERVKENLLTAEHKEVYEKVKQNAALSTKGAFGGSFSDDVAAAYVEGNAFLYLITGEESYGSNAIAGLFEHYETTDHSTADFTYRTAGYEIYISAVVYDWCYDLLKEEEKEKIYNKVIEDAQQTEVGWPPVRQNGTGNGHEGEYQVMRDMLSFAIAAYEDYPLFYNVVMGKLIDEYIPLNNYFYNNTSFHNQGDSYGMYRYSAEMYMTYLMSAIGKGDLISENQRNMAYSFILRRRPDGAHMQDGDMFNTPLTGYISAAKSAFFAGNYYNDPYLRNEFYRSGCLFRSNHDEISAVTYLLLNKPEVGLKDHSELPLTYYAGDQQAVMTARTSWDEGINANTMMVSMKISEYITRSHQHLDSGNFEIYYKGALALDSGIYNGYIYDDSGEKLEIGSGSDHDNNYHHRTIAHNAMLVYDPDEEIKMGTANDGGQRAVDFPDRNRTFDDVISNEELIYGDVLAYDYGDDLYSPSYSYLEGDLTKAYTDKVTDYSRAFMFFNFFDEVYPGALVVFDRVEAKDSSFKKTWLLHSQEEPEISENVTTVRRTELGYNGRLINETLLPASDNLSVSKVGGEGNEFSVGGVNYPALSDEDNEAGKWRLEISPKTEAKSDYFLNVIQVADNTVNPTPLESEYLETESSIGVQIKDRVVYFGKSKERTSGAVTVSGSGTDTLIYTVCGLEAGTWQISGDGYSEEKTAAEKGGVISFTAAAGEYTLTKLSDNTTEKNLDLLSNIKPLGYTKPILKADGYYFDFKAKPYIKNGEIYLPAEEAAGFLRADAQLSCTDSDIEIVYSGNAVKFTADSSRAVKNGNEHIISHIPEMKDGVLYVPLYLLKEFLNSDAYSDPITNITEFSEGKEMLTPVLTETDSVFISEDGAEAAAFAEIDNYSELNVMEYGMVLSPLPNGVIGGEDTVTYSADKASNTGRSGSYGIHIKDNLFKLSPSYYLRPYMIYDRSGSPTTVYAGSGKYIDRYSSFEQRLGTEEATLSETITDDTCSRTNYDTAGNYSPVGEYTRVNIYNGIPVNNAMGNAALHRTLIKLDLSTLTDADFTKEILLNLNGRAGFIEKTETAPETMTVDLYGTYDYEWSESTVAASASSVGPDIEDILLMDKIGSFTVNADETSFVTKSVDIGSFAKKAADAGKTEITVILFADNSSRAELSKENGRDGLYFQMGTRENTVASRRPTVTYNKLIKAENRLSSITVDGVALDGFSPDTTSYTCSYTSEDFPTVSAAAEDSEASVSITQADEINKTAVITVTDKDKLLPKSYKLEFVKELASSLTTTKEAVISDTNSRTNQYSNWYSPTGIYMRTNLYNGAEVNNNSNNTLKRALIQIDLEKLEGVDLTKDIFLNVVGKSSITYPTVNAPSHMTVNVYGDWDYLWDETTVDASANSVGPSISKILEMEKVGSFTAFPDELDFTEKSVNIKEFVAKALAYGKTKITLILFADNTDRVQYSPVGENDTETVKNTARDEFIFLMGTKENESAARQPGISYYKYD